MRFPGFIGQSNKLSSVSADCQRTVNLYPEAYEAGGKEGEQFRLIGTPGLRLLLTLAGGATRGGLAVASGQLFAVGGNKFYRISSSWAATELGTLNSSSGPVAMAENGTYLMLVDGSGGYTFNLTTNTFAAITDGDFPGAHTITYQDGYFLFDHPEDGRFDFVDDVNLDFDALDFATPESSPDNCTAVISDKQSVYAFGPLSTEVYYNSGDGDAPWVRTSGAVIGTGIAARHTAAVLQGSVYWLGQDETGSVMVFGAQGISPQRISTHALEGAIANLIADGEDLSTSRAWVYSQAGHAFYVLNLAGADSTWVYDLSTKMWHERAYLLEGEYSRHRADWHVFAYSTNVVGDYENGKIYALDPETYTDNSAEILRERISPHITKSLKRLFYPSFQLDLETGVGLDGDTQGDDPQAMLSWSDDGGHTWSEERVASIGARGARFARAIWRRLGSSRDRVFRVRISDPVKVVLLGAELEVEEGAA